MTLLHTISELRQWRTNAASPLILVPTMGALHEGHFALVKRARELAGGEGSVAVSLFVNPLQFGPTEDLTRYPRTLEADLAGSQAAGADLVFAPSVDEVYHADRSIRILEQSLSTTLCGASRPGHFDGVCTVVAKLFNLFQPQIAVFGRKDFQQLAIIRRLVRDLNFPVQIDAVETVREPDGLAMSSRNRYLDPTERTQACALFQALRIAVAVPRQGVVPAADIIAILTDHLTQAAPLGTIDYATLVDPNTLREIQTWSPGQAGTLALAVRFGKTRLIDHLEMEPASHTIECG